ncbi:MAG: hypothetical protein ACSLE1_02675 [Sphingobium sp.]
MGHEIVLCRAGLKAPLYRNFPAIVHTKAEVERHRGNWGFKLRQLVLADKDDRNREADLFVRRMGPFYSPQVTVTRRGKHYYVRLPPGADVRSRLHFRGMPLDLLTGAGRFGMGPGSEVNGHVYALQGEIVPPLALPPAREALVDLLIRREEVQSAVRSVCCLPDERARRYLDKVAPAEQGKCGSRAAFVAALKCLSLADGDMSRAWGFLVYFNRTRCFPPFDEEREDGPDSLKRKLREARKRWTPKA